jgi:hypothetical protein
MGTSKDSSFKNITLPMFDFGIGWSFLISDVGSTTPALQLSYGLSIRQSIMPYLSVSLDFSTGKFYGEKALGDTGNINYKTSIINQGIRFTYEASHLFRKNNKGLNQYQPYVGIGVGLISFRAKGDLKDGNQNEYNYWSDGTIRSLPESAINVDLAELISRNNIYESDLRDANIDGFGRYDQMALRIPIELGFRYQFTKRIGAHIKGTYNLNFTDLLDNVTSESWGDRKGNTANDNHISAMVGVSVFLGEYRKPKRKKKKTDSKPTVIAEEKSKSSEDLAETNKTAQSIDVDSALVNQELEIGSGLETKESKGDFNDEKNDDLANSKTVNAQTKSLEKGLENADLSEERDSSSSENAIIPGDPEPKESSENSGKTSESIKTKDAAVDIVVEKSAKSNKENGFIAQNSKSPTLTSAEDIITQGAINEKVNSNSADKELNELTTMNLMDKAMEIRSTEPKLAGSYHWADLDKDSFISSYEVLHFIDLLFDGESKFTVPMIHELIEYYFDQD